MGDIRYAIRSLHKQPVFTAIAVLTLTLGIGANTAIFSLLYRVLLRPLPYRDADRLVFVWNTYPLMGLPQASVSIPDYIDRKTQAPAFEDATLFTMRSVNLTTQGQPEQLRALAVTPSFFTTLGRRPFIGRGFQDDEAQPGADKYAILTYATWTSHFGADPSIVGRDIRLNGESHRVTGVLAADFELPATAIAVLQPFAFTPEQMSDNGRGNEFSQMIARLQPGATIEQANAQMKTIVNRNLERLPARRAFAVSSGFGGYAISLRDQLVGDARAPLYVLQAGVIVLLLIACANVASLLLMRATGRHRELAIRTTLGAGHRRLIRQLLTEGLVLSALGAVAGLAVGWAGVRGLVALSPQEIPGMADASLNPAVMAFTMTLAVITGLGARSASRFAAGGPTSRAFTIVGVAGTINSIDLGEPVAKERIYYPVTQQARPAMALVVKSGVDPKTLVSQVRSAVIAIDPEQPIADVRTMDEWLAQSLEGRRSPMLLLVLFGGVALVLSAIGIYGVLAFAVAQRTREIGIRQALGADRRSILSLVLKQGMSTAAIGVGLGLAGSIALTRYLQALLFGVGAHDVEVYVAVTVLLLSVATVACSVPARRATAVDPNRALRDG
jgi:cell division protein FtsX